MRTAGVQQLLLVTEPGILHVQLDGNEALAVNYDEPSLMTTLDIATPFLGDSPIMQPPLDGLVREQVVPLILTANLDVGVDLQ